MYKVLGNFFQRAYPCIFVIIVNGLCTIIYKDTDEWWTERIQVTARDNEWYTNTVHFKEWMIAILAMTKTDALLQGMDSFK